jgi:hypothetical protein
MHDHQVTSRPRTRPDNKVRLSPDVLEKAEHIAAEWGLKNARAAVEAVFRRYCDDYLYARPPETGSELGERRLGSAGYGDSPVPLSNRVLASPPKCEALDALDQLLAL